MADLGDDWDWFDELLSSLVTVGGAASFEPEMWRNESAVAADGDRFATP
jgi:hypothetical protein